MILEESLAGSPLVQIVWQRLHAPTSPGVGLLVAIWLQFVKRCATRTSTPWYNYILSRSSYGSTSEVTASERSRWRRSRPLTCYSNSGNLPRVWYPPTAESWRRKSPRSIDHRVVWCGCSAVCAVLYVGPRGVVSGCSPK